MPSGSRGQTLHSLLVGDYKATGCDEKHRTRRLNTSGTDLLWNTAWACQQSMAVVFKSLAHSISLVGHPTASPVKEAAGTGRVLGRCWLESALFKPVGQMFQKASTQVSPQGPEGRDCDSFASEWGKVAGCV